MKENNHSGMDGIASSNKNPLATAFDASKMMCSNKRATKKSNLLEICFFIAIILLIPSALSQIPGPDEFHPFYVINHSCPTGTCIEGQPILWTIHFENSGGVQVEYTAFELMDAFNHTPIAEHSIPYYPLRDYRGDIFISWPNRDSAINITSTVPSANQEEGTIFYPCFTTTIDDIHVFVRHNDYVFRQCYDDNWTLPSVQCLASDHCEADQYCLSNKCYDLECESCQFIANHTCNDHQCCESEQCAFNQVCSENLCMDVNCGPQEYLFNRTCRQLNCNFDEYIVDNSCKKLDCASAEYVFNHSCKPLFCASNEQIFNHTCRPCAYNQRLENDSCIFFSCRQNQAYINNSCSELQCNFYQKIGEHECITNSRAIIKLGFETIIIAAIVFFVILDIRKRRSMAMGQNSKQPKERFSLNLFNPKK